MKSDDVAVEGTETAQDAPLVGTLRFVFVMGTVFVLLWFAMYALLRMRW